VTRFTAATSLLRVAIRLDRVRLALWVVIISGVTVATASSFASLYADVAERRTFANSINSNPALVAMIGHVYNTDTTGGLTAWRMCSTAGILIALMSLLTVNRHTRADEESGRLELLGSAVTGRFAAPTAAFLLVAGTSALIGILICLGLVGVGLPAAGSVALGAAICGVGWVFGSIALVCAQLSQSARTSLALSGAGLGVAYALRAIGDPAEVGLGWVAWLSPLEWAAQTRAFASNRWGPLVLAGITSLALVGLALSLVERRDVGAGLVSPRPGPARAVPALRTPRALAIRLQRSLLIGWTIGFGLFGLAMGVVSQSMANVIADNPRLSDIFEQMGGSSALVDAFSASMLSLLAMVAAAFAIQATLVLRSEESTGRAEAVLATPVTRLRWWGSHMTYAVGGPAVLMVVGGLCMGLAHGLDIGDVSGQVPSLLGASLAQLPAIWVVAGLAGVAFGWLPRWTVWAWAALILFMLIGQFGRLLHLAGWVLDLSPFSHVPSLPGAAFDVGAARDLVGLSALAVVLMAVSAVGVRRRDIV
jgi:polyether ionophore transport system permease protein